MDIEKDRVVSIDFKLTNDQGELLDQSDEGTPLVYLHGAAGMVPALQDGLAGKKTGDNFTISMSPEEGFGVHRPELVHEVPRAQFPQDQEIASGMQVTAHSESGEASTDFVVKAVGDDTVTLDGNHPLAGMALTFAGQVVDVRAATDDEVTQGHPLA